MRSLVDAIREERERAYYETEVERFRAGEAPIPKRRAIRGSSLTESDVQLILTLRAKGWTQAAIGKELGRHKSTIQDVLKRHGASQCRSPQVTVDGSPSCAQPVQGVQNGMNGES